MEKNRHAHLFLYVKIYKQKKDESTLYLLKFGKTFFKKENIFKKLITVPFQSCVFKNMYEFR